MGIIKRAPPAANPCSSEKAKLSCPDGKSWETPKDEDREKVNHQSGICTAVDPGCTFEMDFDWSGFAIYGWISGEYGKFGCQLNDDPVTWFSMPLDPANNQIELCMITGIDGGKMRIINGEGKSTLVMGMIAQKQNIFDEDRGKTMSDASQVDDGSYEGPAEEPVKTEDSKTGDSTNTDTATKPKQTSSTSRAASIGDMVGGSNNTAATAEGEVIVITKMDGSVLTVSGVALGTSSAPAGNATTTAASSTESKESTSNAETSKDLITTAPESNSAPTSSSNSTIGSDTDATGGTAFTTTMYVLIGVTILAIVASVIACMYFTKKEKKQHKKKSKKSSSRDTDDDDEDDTEQEIRYNSRRNHRKDKADGDDYLVELGHSRVKSLGNNIPNKRNQSRHDFYDTNSDSSNSYSEDEYRDTNTLLQRPPTRQISQNLRAKYV